MRGCGLASRRTGNGVLLAAVTAFGRVGGDQTGMTSTSTLFLCRNTAGRSLPLPGQWGRRPSRSAARAPAGSVFRKDPLEQLCWEPLCWEWLGPLGASSRLAPARQSALPGGIGRSVGPWAPPGDLEKRDSQHVGRPTVSRPGRTGTGQGLSEGTLRLLMSQIPVAGTARGTSLQQFCRGST